jgi:8-amino-7-oxononanoate synthase
MDLRQIQAACAAEEREKLQRIGETVAFVDQAGLYPDYHRIESAGTSPTCTIAGREAVMLASNDYLGLSRHPEVLEGARAALEVHGTGPGGSRCLCGNLGLLEDLDRALADFLGAEDAITFPTGYMANLSVFKALLDPFLGIYPYRRGAAAVIADECNHATVVDGIALSDAKRFLFKHNDLGDLDRQLSRAEGHAPRLVVTEGVYSLDGETSPLREIADLCEARGALLMVDDAHGIGVMGEHGRGTLEHLGLLGRADLVMGSFDKALGGMGGFLAGRRDVIRFLRIAARGYMFSSALPAVMAGGMLRALDLCRSGALLRRRLRRNADALRAGLSGMGWQVLGDGSVPVSPVLVGDEDLAIRLQRRLLELGAFAPAFRWPSVPRGMARIRVTPMAGHGAAHLEAALEAFKVAGRELGLLA